MRRRPPTHTRSGGLLALPLLLVPVALAAAGLIALIAVSTDVSEALGIPPPVNEYLQRDHLAYPAHATLGQVFQRLGRPSMAALQP